MVCLLFRNQCSSLIILGICQLNQTPSLANIGGEVDDDHGGPEGVAAAAGDAPLHPLVAQLRHGGDALEAESSTFAELGEKRKFEEVCRPDHLAATGPLASLQKVGAVGHMLGLVGGGDEHLRVRLVLGESPVRLHFDLPHKLEVVFFNQTKGVSDQHKHSLVLIDCISKKRPGPGCLELLVDLHPVAGLRESCFQGLNQLGHRLCWIFYVAKVDDQQLGGMPVQPISNLAQENMERPKALVET